MLLRQKNWGNCRSDQPTNPQAGRLSWQADVHTDEQPVVLTDAGHAIREGTYAALQMISDPTEQLVSRIARARLVISTIDSVVEKWLISRLATYSRAHPDFRFDLRVEADPADFARYNIDLRAGL